MLKIYNITTKLESIDSWFSSIIINLLCCWLLKKKVSPIAIIVALFIVGVLARLVGIM